MVIYKEKMDITEYSSYRGTSLHRIQGKVYRRVVIGGVVACAQSHLGEERTVNFTDLEKVHNSVD